MIEISYDNVMNGLNKGFNMTLVSETNHQTDQIFHNAIDLWHIEGFSKVSKQQREIRYGEVLLRFRTITSLSNQSWRGFQGIFLLHPTLVSQVLSKSIFELANQLEAYNQIQIERYRQNVGNEPRTT